MVEDCQRTQGHGHDKTDGSKPLQLLKLAISLYNLFILLKSTETLFFDCISLKMVTSLMSISLGVNTDLVEKK